MAFGRGKMMSGAPGQTGPVKQPKMPGTAPMKVSSPDPRVSGGTAPVPFSKSAATKIMKTAKPYKAPAAKIPKSYLP